MSETPFVHLHFHTGFSLLDGATKIKDATKRAAELGMPALALTDHGVMYGAIDFYNQCHYAGIKPILGCEAYLTPRGRMHERLVDTETGSQSNHQVLLAEDNLGYQNLIRLVSRAHTEGYYYKPRIDLEALALNSKGLIGTSSCLKGKIPDALDRGDMNKALALTSQFIDIFGKANFFIELQDHGIAKQHKVNLGLIQIARKTGLKMIATNDVHYLDRNHAEAHAVMLCLQTGTVVTDPNRLVYHGDQFYMKTGGEMSALFKEFPEAITNTLEIAERCNVDLRLKKDLHFPTYDVPEGYTQKQYLIKLGKQGLRERYGVLDLDQPLNEDEKKIAERFYYELGIIEKTGFINYFLVVWDFINFARSQKIPVGPGRGSGAGCIVAYALGITDIDPLRYDLIFERFLNPYRNSAPDFDIDFCMHRREEVIDYVKRKYGRENVAQIITFGTLGAKTVIRDLARVLEIPLSVADRLAKLVPEDPKMNLKKALEVSPDFRDACENDPDAIRIMQYAPVLEGLPRNQGIHAAGVVIGEKALEEIIPLTMDKNREEPVTQYEMGPIEEVGLLKMDFLGLKTLTIVQEAVDLVKSTDGVEIDVRTISLEDQTTFDLLNRGDTVAVFQVESKGMRDLLRRIALNKFEELSAMIALYRPGPMAFIDDFIDRKHGRKQIAYDHPLLEGILKETYGIMVYQEQVQQAANLLAGYTLGEGDLLRRAMGKKKPAEMAAQREKFVQGCMEKNKIPAMQAGRIFDNIEQFAGYGFNKSHSAAYAVISWQTAYLKAHYPVAFMAANLSIEINNSERIAELITECQAMGLTILPPSVNESGIRFTPRGQTIRFGMAGVKNVGTGAVEFIVKERERGGPFSGLIDFCTRIDGQSVNKKTVESLVRCGAFDFTGLTRSRLFAGIEFAMTRAAETQRDRAVGQFSLFDQPGMEAPPITDEELPEVAPWPQNIELAAEKELIGFYISGHPLAAFAWTLKTYATASGVALPDLETGTMVRMGGLVAKFRKMFTKKDQRAMCSFSLEMLDGELEVTLFPDAFAEYGVHLRDDAGVLVCGKYESGEFSKVIGYEVYPLGEVQKHFADRVSLHVPAAIVSDDLLVRLKQVIRSCPGTMPLSLVLIQPGGESIFLSVDHQYKVDPSEKFVREVEKLLGEESAKIVVKPSPCLRSNGSRNGRFRDRRRPAPV
ncbi:MAG TPA: DNA polymerase III subunit alpha [Pirellulaceae bacterium]|nr:DNA polymerase III subunit alpha [Pirellulaceae bacterium]